MESEIVFASGRVIRPVRVVLIDGQPTRVKRCAFCREDLPIERFMVMGRDRFGDANDWQPRCKTCEPPFRRLYARLNRDAINAGKRAYDQTRRRRETRAINRALASPIVVAPAGVLPEGQHPGGAYLPASMFRRWLTEYALREHLEDAETIAGSLGMVSRRVRSVLAAEQKMVALDTVDRALTESSIIIELDGVPIVTVDDLYPGYRPSTRTTGR